VTGIPLFIFLNTEGRRKPEIVVQEREQLQVKE